MITNGSDMPEVRFIQPTCWDGDSNPAICVGHVRCYINWCRILNIIPSVYGIVDDLLAKKVVEAACVGFVELLI